MGNIKSDCGKDTIEAKGTSNDTKAYQWYGLHVLSAKCQPAGGPVQFGKELNIYGIIVASLAALIVLWIVFKMMKRSDGGSSYAPMG